MDCKVEPDAEQGVESLRKSSASSKRDNLSSSSSTGSSFQELLSACDLSSARGRLSRESHSQRGQSEGQSSEYLLTRQLSVKLDKLELIPRDQERASVIARTPSRSPITSTPSNSLLLPPIPPKTCQSLGPIVLPRSRFHSPTCSDLSSINGEVFSDTEIPVTKGSSIAKPQPLSQTAPSVQIPLIHITEAMEAIERECWRKKKKLYYRMRSFHPGNINGVSIATFDAKIEDFEKVAEDFVLSVEDLCLDHADALGPEKVNQLENLVKTAESDVQDYKLSMERKVDEVRRNLGINQDSSSQFQEASLQLKRQQNDIAEKALLAKEKENSEKLSETLRESGSKKAIATAKARNKCDAIFNDGDELSTKIGEVGDWDEASDLTVGRAMRNIKTLKEDLEKIVDVKRSLEDLVATYDLTEDDDVQLSVADAMVDRLSGEVREVIDAIKEQDDVRELYTLDAAKTDNVKLPTFEGRDNEDFSKFKELVLKAFVQNRVSKADKLAKLREVLRGHAKKLVPESTTNSIDDAWEALEKAFGEPDRLMKSRKEALGKLGSFPKETARGGFQSQVEWFLEFEALLRSIIDLGKKSDGLGMEAFSPSTIRSILGMFSTSLLNKLIECPGQGCSKLEAILKKISEFRSKAQKVLLVKSEAAPAGGGGGGGQKDGHGYSRGSNKGSDIQADFGLIAYKPPRRDDGCRICLALEARGDTNLLYDDHVHNYPTGCPRYMAFSIEERIKIAQEARLCMKCHNPEYVWKKVDKDHDCPIKPGMSKSRYTCSVPNCTNHMWTCIRHRKDNGDKLKKFKEEILRKYTLDFGYFVSIPVVANKDLDAYSIGMKPGSRRFRAVARKGAKDAAKKSTDVAQMKIVDPVAASCDHKNPKNLSNDQALNKLKRKLSAVGVNEELFQQ